MCDVGLGPALGEVEVTIGAIPSDVVDGVEFRACGCQMASSEHLHLQAGDTAVFQAVWDDITISARKGGPETEAVVLVGESRALSERPLAELVSQGRKERAVLHSAMGDGPVTE